MASSQLYLIWSHEHDAWWAPNSHGYTPDEKVAGRFTREEAANITLDVVPPGIEVAVHETDAMLFGKEAVYGLKPKRDV